ncbi:hypothetical protein BE08_11895 [Sorangium cellulosum]|uniref:Uncharacterized protein n=1 Tax=Sorangium cellulosum TaxID=56 RepID=A0A150PG16_SORCE|nr:hypothetical protein BE08_11895 [Sorangium cellulosum]
MSRSYTRRTPRECPGRTLDDRFATGGTSQFYERYIELLVLRELLLQPAQNNHPIRTATALGYVALAFPEPPEAAAWWNWSLTELEYLWGPDGQYVQPDGGVSEGPYYAGFAWGPSAALFIALDNSLDGPAPFLRDCRTRSNQDPWTGHGCVDGEAASLDPPLREGPFTEAAAWSLALRTPWGSRPPLEDAVFTAWNGPPLLTSFGGSGAYVWDWLEDRYRPREMEFGVDLIPHHLIYLDDAAAAEEPPFLTRCLPDAGNAVFRSDWGEEARWLLLVAEDGAAQRAGPRDRRRARRAADLGRAAVRADGAGHAGARRRGGARHSARRDRRRGRGVTRRETPAPLARAGATRRRRPAALRPSPPPGRPPR